MESSLAIGGKVSAKLHRGEMHELAPLAWKLRNLPNLLQAWRVPFANLFKIPTFYGKLYAQLHRADGSMVDYGLVSMRVVTTAFCEFLVDQLQTESSTIGDYKYHDTGTGTTGAAIGDTSMETVVTDNLRAVGTQVETSSVIYKSVGTMAYTGGHNITEHGLFNSTRATGPTLLDRHTFTAIAVINGDSITFTYELTVTAGG